jgi:putative drug exporter of the RND superfamily
VALVTAIGLQGAVGGSYSTDFSLPGAESQKAFDLLDKRFPNVAGDTAEIVFKADRGVDDPEVRSAMEGLLADISKVDRVVAIDSPYSEQGALLAGRLVEPRDETGEAIYLGSRSSFPIGCRPS